jgi:hypothetical protein
MLLKRKGETMRPTTFFLNPGESRFRQLIVIDMARSFDREWTARVIIKTDLVEKRSYELSDFSFKMGAFDADVGMEFTINNYEHRYAQELLKWRGVYPISIELKETISGFEHPNKLAKYLRDVVFTLERVAGFQDDMDNNRSRYRGKRNRNTTKLFEEKRKYFVDAINKHFGNDLDMGQMSLETEAAV